MRLSNAVSNDGEAYRLHMYGASNWTASDTCRFMMWLRLWLLSDKKDANETEDKMIESTIEKF